MSSRYHLLQTDDTYLWAAAGVSITVILVVLLSNGFLIRGRGLYRAHNLVEA